MKKRVVVTGMGALTPIGNNVEKMWENAKKGVCGIDVITKFDTMSTKVKLAAQLKDFNETDYLDKKECKRLAGFTKYALIAAKEAMQQSGLTDTNFNHRRAGVVLSSGIGGIEEISTEQNKGMNSSFDRVSPLFIPQAISNMAAGAIAIEFGLQGSSTCVVTACAGATDAIGSAFRQIRDGYADVMFAGGSENAITPLGVGGFTAMRALHTGTDCNRASIPFDKERSGFVMGEGAGVVVLEEYEHAVARGATILGEVVGYASNCDANHITAPLEDGSGASECMFEAIEDANIQKEEIGYINAHGTSTPLNDRCETAAIRRTFGQHCQNIAVSSTKAMTGHLLGAAGGVEAIMCIKALQEGVLPPTINYEVEDENCDLDIIPNIARKKEVTYAMSNSLGFGGHNASLLFKKV